MATLLREGYPNWARSVNSTLNFEEPPCSVVGTTEQGDTMGRSTGITVEL